MSLKTRLNRLEEHADLGPEWVLQVVWAEDEPREAQPGSITIILHWERPTR
jgi:hypothetical protein